MKFKKLSADEARDKRKTHLYKAGSSEAIAKAAKEPTSWDKAARSARFVMSTQGVDRYGDIIVTAGIDTTEFMTNPIGLMFHAARQWPVGTWSDLTKELTKRPPRLEGNLNFLPADGPVKEVDQAAWMVANGGIKACSIGFIPNWDDVEGIEDDDGFTIGLKFNSSILLETSICGLPANPQALIKEAGGDPVLARELIEDVLDNWARDPSGLLVPRAELLKTHEIVVRSLAADKTAPKATIVVHAPLVAKVEEKAGLPTGVTVEIAKPIPVVGLGIKAPTVEEKADADLASVLAKADKASDISVWKGIVESGERTITVTPVPGLEHKLEIKGWTERHTKMVEARIKELGGSAPSPAPAKTIEVKLEVDTDEATKKVGVFERMIDGVAAKLAKLFPAKPQPEPIPTDDQMKAAKDKAAATIQRLRSKGMA